MIPHGAMSCNGSSVPANWPQLASKYGLDPRATPVVSVGTVGPAKCPEVIIDGFALLARPDSEVVLAFVGDCDPSYRRQIEARAVQVGVAGRVVLTGRVDEAELDNWLAAARCAVQLRFPTNGESSGSVTRCLAAGVPTVVSDHGPLRELPDNAVLKVPAQVEPAELAQVIQGLVDDHEARNRLRQGALRYSREVSLEAVVDRFWTEVIGAS